MTTGKVWNTGVICCKQKFFYPFRANFGKKIIYFYYFNQYEILHLYQFEYTKFCDDVLLSF